MATAGAVVGIIGAAYGAYSTEKAGQQARADRRDNARAILEENREQARRLKKEQDQTVSLARARAGAAGVGAGGTVQNYINEMQKNFALERDWLAKSGVRGAAAERRAGRYEAQTARAGAWGTLFKGVGSAATNLK